MTMGETIKRLFIFASGAALGSVLTYGFLKTKYERIINDETQEMREYYLNKYAVNNEPSDEEEDHDDFNEEVKEEYEKSVTNYTSYSEKNKDEEDEEEEEYEVAPYIIDPDDFNQFKDYEEIYLTYYADKKLADDMDKLVEDVDGTVGLDNLKVFDDPNEDSVYIRNERLKADYEILRVLSNYEEE